MNHSYNEDGHLCVGGCGLICGCTLEDGYCENAGWRCESCRNKDPSWQRHIERVMDGYDDHYEDDYDN